MRRQGMKTFCSSDVYTGSVPDVMIRTRDERLGKTLRKQIAQESRRRKKHGGSHIAYKIQIEAGSTASTGSKSTTSLGKRGEKRC